MVREGVGARGGRAFAYGARWVAFAVVTLAATLPLGTASHASDGGPNAPRDTNVLALSSVMDVAALAGGDGQVVLSPSRLTDRETIVGNVALTVHAPAVARLRGARGVGWRCRIRAGGRRISCRHAVARPRAGTIRPVAVALDAGPNGRFGTGALRARVTWLERDGRRWEADSTTERVPLVARRPLTVAARAIHPRVPDAVSGRQTAAIALKGTVGRRTDEPIRYAWRQLCRRGTPCPRVRWRSTHSGPLGTGQPVASFAPPQVRRAQTLRFALTASDHRGAVTRSARVRVEPSEIARMAPRFGATRDAGALLDDAPRAGAPVRIDAGDRARVRVGGVGGTVVRPGGRVRIAGDVLGQAERSVRWGVVRGPRGMLAGVRRDRRTLTFRAPRAEGTYVISMVATTAAGRFERDELITVDAARAVVRRARTGSARAAGQPAARRAFCALLTRIRSTRGEIDIPLESGESLTARAPSVPPGDECSGQERIAFTAGRAELGGFRMAELAGRITLDRGAVVESGRLVAPDFWSRAVPASRASGQGRAAARSLRHSQGGRP